jgi:adenosine kinase
MSTVPYLLSGSFAYDTLLRHPAPFQNSILPEAVARLNVCFDIDSVHEEFGGAAGNIAYNASILGQSPMLVGSVGEDLARYVAWLRKNGLNDKTLTFAPNKTCAHCWITTDTAGNQISGFSRGALLTRPLVPKSTPQLWHLGPEYPVNTAYLARQAIEEGKDFFFDPGQALPDFLSGMAEHILPLHEMLSAATGIFVNNYEAELLIASTGQPLERWLTEPGQFYVRTRGSKGVTACYVSGSGSISTFESEVAPTDAVLEPTGCGDAFRAGFLYGHTHGWSVEETLALGAVMGSFAVEAFGGQNHRPGSDKVWQRYSTFRETAAVAA